MILFVTRIIFISTTMVIDDEAYYNTYSHHLAWGYIDHGPVVAFLIKAFTTAFGENGVGIRIGGLFLLTILGLILYWFGKRYFDITTGIVLSLTVLPNVLFHTNGIVITPDAPMAFFTILAIISYYVAFFHDKRFFWPGGLFLGLSLMSKISALFPALGIILYPFIIKEERGTLKEKQFYVSLVIAFLVVLPFIIWNLQNELAFVRYQGAHVTTEGGLVRFLKLWSALALLVGPVLFYYTICLPIRYLLNIKDSSGRTDVRSLYFSLVSVFPMIYFFVHSLFSRFEVNWPAPAFFGGLFLFSVFIGERWKSRKILFHLQLIYSLSLIAIITLQIYFPFLPVKGGNDITNRYFVYSGFKTELKEYFEHNPQLSKYRIVANNYQIPSMVNLYVQPSHEAVCLSIGYHKTLFSFLYPDSSLVGDDFLFITRGKAFPEKLRSHFDEVRFLTKFESRRGRTVVSEFGLWFVKCYKGKGRL